MKRLVFAAFMATPESFAHLFVQMFESFKGGMRAATICVSWCRFNAALMTSKRACIVAPKRSSATSLCNTLAENTEAMPWWSKTCIWSYLKNHTLQ
jgi:hypothetical protein